MSLIDSSAIPKNRLLAALPLKDYEQLIPYLEAVALPIRTVLYREGEMIDWVYFPSDSMVSLVVIMEDGATAEVALVGKEGMIGVTTCLGNTIARNEANVQIADGAMRMSAHQLKIEFDRGGALQQLLLRYTELAFSHASRLAACNRLHTIEERLARWLLMVQDSMEIDQFPLTQEIISQMLGVRRSGVTLVIGVLQKAGIIQSSRGMVRICDRPALEAVACECYGVMRLEIDQLSSFRPGFEPFRSSEKATINLSFLMSLSTNRRPL
ncbi:Crp/Fnr family transcriptional regulator [Phormidesmis sp. 146-12]